MATTATLTADEVTRVSTTAAEDFTEAYYNALNSARTTIASFYIPPSAVSGGRPLPLITFNGEQLADPTALQTTFDTQMPYTFFDVQSLNVHVMNPTLTEIGSTANKAQARSNMSLLVQVSGYVRLVERKEGPMRGFSDSMVLVPNKEEAGGKGKAKSGEGRNWLIQTQNFRFVV